MKSARMALVFVLVALLAAVIPPASADGTFQVYVTSQRFEHGVMYWRSDTGFVWVLFDNGQAWGYPSTAYGALPDNPFISPPPGRVRPINGYGKLWGHYAAVRDRIGWATNTEIGFWTQIVTVGYFTYLIELDGRIVAINPNFDFWNRVSTLPPPISSPKIERFAVSPDPVGAGGTLTISWSVTGSEMAILEVYDTAQPAWPYLLLTDLPLSGASEVAVPTNATALRIVIWAANRYHGYTPVAMYERVIKQERTVSVQRIVTGTACARAAYQRYDGGFMLWREDTGAVIVFWGKSSGQFAVFDEGAYGSLPDNPYTTPPAGRVAPVNGFGKVWGNHDWVRNLLGWALGPEQGYDMVIETLGVGAQSYLLPDGRTVTTTANTWLASP
jgi:hypothetical protein